MVKIVLIEDNAEVRENTAEILELAGYEVYPVAGGMEGIEKIREVVPDLIICDIMMPELDGYGVLHIISKEEPVCSVPFILLTAKTEKKDFRKGMNLGADDYLTKPFEETDLLNAVKTRLYRTSMLRKEFTRDNQGLNDFLKEARTHFDLNELSVEAKKRRYGKKDYIFMKGSIAPVVYLINKGRVKTYRTNDEGKELTVKLHKKGEFIGYNALLRNTYYEESAVALEETEVSVISKEDFYALLYNNRDVCKKFIRMLSDDLRHHEEKMMKLAYHSVRSRVADALMELLKRFYEDDQNDQSINMSRENLASLAGTTTETLIRILREFKEEGLIEINRRQINIREMNKLKKLV